jgi:hypothetical protein
MDERAELFQRVADLDVIEADAIGRLQAIGDGDLADADNVDVVHEVLRDLDGRGVPPGPGSRAASLDPAIAPQATSPS